MFKRVRIIVSVFFALVCIALTCSWLTSFWRYEELELNFTNKYHFELWSMDGALLLWAPGTDGWVWQYTGATFMASFKYWEISHWIPILASAIFAVLPWLRIRFGLRSVFAATTFAAFALGTIVCLTR